MSPHIHVSVLDFLKVGAYVVIWGFFWRFLSTKYHHTAVGQAMAFID